MFQSSPAHMGRALAEPAVPNVGSNVFQSSPAHMGRALDLFCLVNSLPPLFQSSPAHMGRALVVAGVYAMSLDVSILARPHGAGAPSNSGPCR